jgi:hypothetical protein
MHPRALTRFIASALAAVTFAASGVKTEEISLLLSQASSAYRSGDYTQAMRSLDSAGLLIHRKKTAALVDDLPAALPGWTAGATESNAPAALGEMALVAVQRTFTHGECESTVHVALTEGASEVLAGIPDTLGRERDLVTALHYDQATRTGSIARLLRPDRLATVAGSGVSREQLIAYAGRMRA